MGDVSEIAKAAIASLKNSPAVLGLMLLNLIVFGLIYFGATSNVASLHRQLDHLIERCLPKAAFVGPLEPVKPD